jgi:hypothetical protein
MSNKKILLTFVGGNDIKSDNAAIEQILKTRDISEAHIFLTKDFEKSFEESKRLEMYKKISKAKFKIYNTGIENPTQQREIYEKIKGFIEEIKTLVEVNKDICLINLSSGTPDIKAVWSVLMAIDTLPSKRFYGIYAPNPDYDTNVRIDDLKFYKNSYAYNIINLFIEKYNYLALSEFLEANSLPDLLTPDFKNVVNFAKCRTTCAYNKAEEIYQKTGLDKYFKFQKPENLLEKSVEYFYSAKISDINNDNFASILKLAIIRENILEYLIEKLLGYKNIGDKKDDKPYHFNLDKIRKNEPELENYLRKYQINSESKNKEFNFNAEISAYSKTLIFKYLVDNKFDDILLKKILNRFERINALPKSRNDAAHNITNPVYDKKWIKYIEDILNFIFEYTDSEEYQKDIYEKINTVLKNNIKI